MGKRIQRRERTIQGEKDSKSSSQRSAASMGEKTPPRKDSSENEREPLEMKSTIEKKNEKKSKNNVRDSSQIEKKITKVRKQMRNN